VLALILVSCGGAAPAAPSYPRDVAFEDHGTVSQSGIEQSTPAIAVAVDSQAKAELEALARPGRPVPDDRIAIAVFQGEQRTGGYSVKVERITLRTATTLEITAVFSEPPSDAIVIQVLTSPAHIVSVARADVSGVDRVVLVDASGKQRASVTVPIR
jgi:hypothetical protein